MKFSPPSSSVPFSRSRVAELVDHRVLGRRSPSQPSRALAWGRKLVFQKNRPDLAAIHLGVSRNLKVSNVTDDSNYEMRDSPTAFVSRNGSIVGLQKRSKLIRTHPMSRLDQQLCTFRA